jgi:hypothetical protein
MPDDGRFAPTTIESGTNHSQLERFLGDCPRVEPDGVFNIFPEPLVERDQKVNRARARVVRFVRFRRCKGRV